MMKWSKELEELKMAEQNFNYADADHVDKAIMQLNDAERKVQQSTIPVEEIERQIDSLLREKELQVNSERQREIDIAIEALENLLWQGRRGRNET